MISYFHFFNIEFFIFFVIETAFILLFILFFRHSRNNGGVFDRRLTERRKVLFSVVTGGGGRRIMDIGIYKINPGLSANSELFNDENERRITERRTVSDRRNNNLKINNRRSFII